MFFIHTHPARACPCAKNAVFTFHLNPFFANYFSTLCFWASFFKALVISSSDKFTEKAPSILQMMSTRSKIVFGLVGIALIKFKRASLLMYRVKSLSMQKHNLSYHIPWGNEPQSINIPAKSASDHDPPKIVPYLFLKKHPVWLHLI